MATTGTLRTLMAEFGGEQGEEKARQMLESIRWPEGPRCPRCGAGGPYALVARPTSRKPGRAGLYKCRAKGCRRQFTVRVGTVMEDSHIAYSVWVIAFNMMSSSKKGISAHWLHRQMGLSYKAAWFMAHRIREAMKRPPLSGKLQGVVEADETYIGGRPRAFEKGRKDGRGTKKLPVFALVERGGDVRSFPVWKVTGRSLKSIIREQVDKEADLFTDELYAYRNLHREFGDHQTVLHSQNEYVRGDVHVNTVEGFFSILKRGINGVYHHVGRQHLGRYLHEFDFRYSGRKLTDGERAARAVKGAEGRRLTYRQPAARN